MKDFEFRADPIYYQDLPEGRCQGALERQLANNIYGYLSKPLIDDLATFFSGRNVLECYAGRGHLSALLHERGVSIRSTSLRQGHDGSNMSGHVFDVEDISITEAIAKYRDWMDALLVCWPTTDYGMQRAASLLPGWTPIVFIGEVTDYTQKPPFLGGCATDEFFNSVKEIKECINTIRYPTFCQDKVKIYCKK